MEWLKKNLFLLGWGALALTLTIVAFVFLYTQRERDAQLQEAVDQKRRDLAQVLGSNPQPNPTNIAAARRDHAQAEKLLADARTLLVAPTVARMDAASFRKHLEDTKFGLLREGQASRVALPTNFAFSFSVQLNAVQFSPGSLEPLTARLEEVKGICDMLFRAGVHSLDGLRRVSVAADDNGSAAEILLQPPETNDVAGVVAYPYEVTFTCFSRQLGLMLDSVLKSPQYFIVRNITVDPAPTAPGAAPIQPRPAPGTDDAAPVDDAQPRPAVPAFPTAGRPGTPRQPTGPKIFLDEKLLRVTLVLEVLVPRPAK